MLALLLANAAFAGPFDRKTTMEDWPDQQVDQALVLPRGWLALGVGGDTLSTDRVRGKRGVVQDLTGDTRWSYSRLWLTLDQGFSSRLTLRARVPYVMARLHTVEGADITTRAPGDVVVGATFQPWAGERAAAAVDVELKAPSGVEWPSNLDGEVEGFLTGTGVTNLGLHARARWRAHERVAVTGAAGWVFKIPAVVGYVVQTDGYGNGWLDPGDEARGSLDVTAQLIDPLALTLGATASWRGQYRAGVSGDSVWGLDLANLPGGKGMYAWGHAGASWWFGEHWALGYDASLQLAGADNRTWGALGLEEFAPQPGLTHALRGEVRW